MSLRHPHVHLGAPPGFGKTVLLGQLMRYYMRSGRGTRVRRDFDMRAESGGIVMYRVREAIASAGRGCLLISIDNVSQEHMRALARIVASIPKRVRVFTAGKPLAPSFSGYMLAGVTKELSMCDLAFGQSETAALPAPAVAEMAGGWPLVCSYAAGFGVDAFETSLGHEHGMLRLWMREAFFEPLPPEERALLLAASVLETVTPGLLSALCSCPVDWARGFLDRLYFSGYPLEAVSSGFRMQKLFGRYLQNELEASGEAETAWRSAANLYHDAGMPEQAARCSLKCRDVACLLEAIEKGALTSVVSIGERENRGEIERRIESLRSELPALRHNSPRLLIVLSQHLFRAGRVETARALSSLALGILRGSQDAEGLVQAVVVHARMLRYAFCLRECGELLARTEAENPSLPLELRYDILAERVVTYTMDNAFSQALAVLEELKTAAEAAQDEKVALWCVRLMTVPYFYQGRYAKAVECYSVAARIPRGQYGAIEKHEVRIFAAECYNRMGAYDVASQMIEERLAEDGKGFYGNLWLVYCIVSEMEFERQRRRETAGLEPDYGAAARIMEKSAACAAQNRKSNFYLSIATVNLAVAAIYTTQSVDLARARQVVADARAWGGFHLAMALSRVAEYLLRRSRACEETRYGISCHLECIELERTMGTTFFGLLSRFRLGLLHRAAGLSGTAAEYLTEAFEIAADADAMGAFDNFSASETDSLFEFARESGAASDFAAFAARAEKRVKPRRRLLAVELFGAFCARAIPSGERVAFRRKKVRELFAYLILHGEKGASRDGIVRDLWPGHSRERAVQNFYVTLSYLRSALAACGVKDCVYLESRGLYRLDASPFSFDLDIVRTYEERKRLMESIASTMEDGEAAKAREAFAANVTSTAARPLLPEFDAAWAKRLRRRYQKAAEAGASS